MKIEQGNLTYKQLGYSRYMSKDITQRSTPIAMGDFAGGDLEGRYPRPTVVWGNLVPDFFSQDDAPTASDIALGKMAFWEDTNDSNRLYLCYNRLGTIKTVELT